MAGVAGEGPSRGVLPPSMLDTSLIPVGLCPPGVMLGAGGVVALDDRGNVLEVARRFAVYNAAESCGKCTPCREGTSRMVEALERLLSGRGSPSDLHFFRYILASMASAL